MKILLIGLLFIPLFSLAQQYSEVVEVPNKNSLQLYRNAKEWFALTFKSSNDVIQLDDSIQKKIIGNGIRQVAYIQLDNPTFLNVYFTLSVQFKDGRYKYDIQCGDMIPKYGTTVYNYELMKSLTNEEGVVAYYKTMNIKPWIIGKKQIQKGIENTKLMLIELDNQMCGIIYDLTLFLKKEDNSNDW